MTDTTYLNLATSLVKQLEGCKLEAYLDTGGKPTIGYGHTGLDVKLGLTITQEVADHLLNQDLAIADDRLSTCIFGHEAPLTAHQHAALLSFVFNLGAEKSWTIWADINKGNLGDVPAQILRFDHGEVGGKLVTIPGLAARRQAEVNFWKTPDTQVPETVTVAPQLAAAAQAGASSSYTRPLPTPPVPVPPPPLAKASITTKVVTAVAGAATAAGTAGSQLHDIVAPHVDEAPLFRTLAVAASGLVVASAIVGLLIHAEQAHARTQ